MPSNRWPVVRQTHANSSCKNLCKSGDLSAVPAREPAKFMNFAHFTWENAHDLIAMESKEIAKTSILSPLRLDLAPAIQTRSYKTFDSPTAASIH